MTDFDDFLGKSVETVRKNNHLELVEGRSYACITCSEMSTKVLFDKFELTLYWYCSNNHESKVDLSVGTIRD